MPTTTAEPLNTQALLQAGVLDDSLPNPPSLPVVTPDIMTIIVTGADEMRRRLLQVCAGEAGRLPQGDAPPFDYLGKLSPRKSLPPVPAPPADEPDVVLSSAAHSGPRRPLLVLRSPPRHTLAQATPMPGPQPHLAVRGHA